MSPPKCSALDVGAQGWVRGALGVVEGEDSSILTKYEVEINLHYIVHVLIKLSNSVTGKILNRLISVKCSR